MIKWDSAPDWHLVVRMDCCTSVNVIRSSQTLKRFDILNGPFINISMLKCQTVGQDIIWEL